VAAQSKGADSRVAWVLGVTGQAEYSLYLGHQRVRRARGVEVAADDAGLAAAVQGGPEC
jgi:hypothetical protein